MKNLIVFSLIVVLLSSCGIFRPSSINEKDDQYNRRLRNNVTADSIRDSQNIRKNNIELDAEEKALKGLNRAATATLQNNNATGLAVNNYNKREVKYEFWLGSRQVKGITLGPKQEKPVTIPFGIYLVKYYESRYKGPFLKWIQKKEVNNLLLEEKNGQNFNFIVSN